MLLASSMLAVPMLASAQLSTPATPAPAAPPVNRVMPAPSTPSVTTTPSVSTTQAPATGTTSGAAAIPTPGTASSDLNRAVATQRASATTAYPAGSMMAVRMRMTQVIGSKVYNERNEAIGEIEDIVLHGASAGPVAVLQVGGFLGLGGRLVAVPLNDLMWNRERERVTLSGATKEMLQARPAFEFSTLRQG